MHAPPNETRPFSVTWRMVIAIALPMTFAWVTTPLIGVTDTAVIGQLGDAVLIGAVALGAILFDILGTVFNFLRMGTTGLVAQAMGADDRDAEANTLWRALLLAVVLGGAVVLLQDPLRWLFVQAMNPSAQVAEATAQYWAVRVWSLPLMLANYAILGWLVGLARTGMGLALQTLLGVVNITASILFVLAFSWGVTGVAAASVLAEGVTLAAGAVVVARSLGSRPWPRRAAILERAGLAAMLTLNRDILIRSAILIATFAFFSGVGARLGDLTLAANAILFNVLLVGAYFLDGLAAAAEQLGGRAVGARYKPAFDRTVRMTVTAGFVAAGLLSLGVSFAAEPFVRLMTTAPEVRSVALDYFVWAALAPVVGALAYIMDGLFIGATWSAAMRNMMLVSAALFLLVWWLTEPVLGNHGLWLALLVFLGARGVTLLVAMRPLARRTFANDSHPVGKP